MEYLKLKKTILKQNDFKIGNWDILCVEHCLNAAWDHLFPSLLFARGHNIYIYIAYEYIYIYICICICISRPRFIILYHLEKRWCNSDVLVYHGPVLFATFWEWLTIYFHCGVIFHFLNYKCEMLSSLPVDDYSNMIMIYI